MNNTSINSTEDQLLSARQVMSILMKAGGTVLMVGGCVRDMLLGQPVGDIDLATDLDLVEVARHFPLHDIGRNKDFNIAVLQSGGWSFEIARFRGRTSVDGSGRPEQSAVAATFIEDAAHRDFTINAMAMDSEGRILDPFGGKADLAARVIRCVGDAEERMKEDPLRALRAVRFAARFGFTIDPDTATAIRGIGPKLAMIAAERISGELLKIAGNPGSVCAVAIGKMAELEILSRVLPEVEALQKLLHNPEHHPEGGVFAHTLAALTAYPGQDFLVNLAILFHDIGKAVTLSLRNENPTYHGHERAGVPLIHGIAERLKLPGSIQQALVFAVERHMQVMRLEEMRPAKVKILIADRNWPLLKEVARADCAAKGDAKAVQDLERTIVEAERRSAPFLVNPVVTGTRIIQLTGLTPGPEVGRVIREVTEWAIDNGIFDQDEIDSRILKITQIIV